jgi:hypothetical protein
MLVAALASLAVRPARADLPVAPPPREVRPDGSRDPAPQPEPPAKPEDPAAVVDRIIQNSKDVGDKLAKTDTGTGTRKTQDKILSDIDSLINRQENPPPPKSGDNKDQNKNQDQSKYNKDQKDNKDQGQPKNNDPMMNKGMGGDPMMKDGMPPPKGDMPKTDTPMGNMGMGSKQDGMPMGGMNDPHPMGGQGNKGGRRPRMGDRDHKKQEQPEPKPDAKPEKKGGSREPNNDAKNPGGTAGGNVGGKAKGIASLPFNEDVAKDVWGHLPDRLRRQMTQYYKEDAMPKYAELLRLYFSSLSDKSPGPMMPRK